MKHFLAGLCTSALCLGILFGMGYVSNRAAGQKETELRTTGGDSCFHLYHQPVIDRSENAAGDVTVITRFFCQNCGHEKSESEFIPHECVYESESSSVTDKYLNETVTTVYTCIRCGKSYTEEEYIPYPIPAYNADDWYLVLVNRHHRITKNPDIALTQVQASGEECVDSRIAGALYDMLAACRAAGLSPYICSSYRTWWLQDYLYTNKVTSYVNKGYSQSYAEKKAALETAIPGTSEHQTGLAVDIVASSYRLLNEKQATTAEQKWLMEHCWEYGFVLRYPVGKTDFTGIIYEPWHYRYVGRDLAEYLTKAGLCLEELLDPEYIFTDTDY